MGDFQGKTCPYCKTVIGANDNVRVCPTCAMPHHQSCWNENNGCTTFGCPEQHVGQHANPAQEASSQYIGGQPSVTSPAPIALPRKKALLANAPLIFAAIGALLFIIGVFYPVPSREFSFRELHEYVGGDAYNASIEAAIRGGEIAGAKAAKAILVCGGLILSAISLFNARQLKIDTEGSK